MRKLLIFSLLCLVVPFVVMAGEYLWALVSGATGERFAAAGFWGVAIGYFSIPVGLLLLLVFFLLWALRS